MNVAVRVLGIDPSLTATGLALPDGELRVYGGEPALGDARLVIIHEAVEFACLVGAPHLTMIEDLPTHAHAAGITGMVQGVIRLALLQAGVPYVKIVPSSLKKYATGNGGSMTSKSDMRMAMFKRTGIDERNDNKVDAFWLRAMGMDHLGAPLVALPALNRAALAAVRWPE